ncbi:MAG TPA: zf-HC2 domain-containing protein [Actinomycetota bacterium]|nr:zf-HC2 domain-containing protein [Actinomycetota bacterium]
MSVFDRFRRKRRSREAVGSLTCSELVEIITDYVEGTLPPADRARFDSHLAICEGCHIYLDQMRLTIRAAGGLREESIPPQAKEALLGAFRAWKQQQ